MPYFLGVGPLELHALEVQRPVKNEVFTKDCFLSREL